MVIDIQINTKNAVNMLKGYEKTIPAGARRGMWVVAQKIQSEIRKEIIKKKLIHTGELLGSVKALKLSKDIYGISMAKRGRYLDHTIPHYVKIKNRRIGQWVKDKFGAKRISGMSRLNKQTGEGALFVTPHPFVAEPFYRVVKQTKGIVEGEINKAIRRRGR